MRLLLDTQVILSAAVAPERLGNMAGHIEDSANELLVSAACSWEIAIKYAIEVLHTR